MNSIEKFNTAVHKFQENYTEFEGQILLYYNRDNDVVYNFGKIANYYFDRLLNIGMVTSECVIMINPSSYRITFNDKDYFKTHPPIYTYINTDNFYIVDSKEEEIDIDSVKLFIELQK